MRISKKDVFGNPEAVTVNTDASYDPIAKTGGYAFWIKSDTFTLKDSGGFKGTITDSNEAEIKALVNALHYLEQKSRKDFSILVINCDNAVARDIVNKRKVSPRFVEEGSILLTQLSRFKMSYAKAIKGHQSCKDARHWVNNWCDRESRSYKKKKVQ